MTASLVAARLLPLWPYLLGAAVLAAALTAMARRVALVRGIVSRPRRRDMHRQPTPRLGGVAIVVTFLLIFALAQILSPGSWFTDELRFGVDRHALGIMLGAIILLLFGIADDIKGLSPGRQLLGQLLAAGAIVFAGIGIDFITNPFGPSGSLLRLDQLTLTLFNVDNYTVTLTVWSDFFTLVWLVGMMNVMNWFDGLDGLAAGVSGIAALLLALLSASVGSPFGILALLIILLGALLGFLPFNFHPAKIFMGTAGSTFIGFLLGVAAIISGGKIATALLVLGVPVLDALWVVVRRLWSGHSIWRADRLHLHHRLVDAGLSVRNAVIALYAISLTFGLLALWHNNLNIKLQLAAVLALLVTIIGISTVAARHRQVNRKS